MVFDDIYEEVCDIFLKYISADQIRKDKYLIRHFINLALREVILTVCPFCHGRGVIKTKNSIDKCYHCEGTGQFIYDDDNRPEFLGIDKEEYKKFKKPYMETLNFVKNIEINALAKIGDD
jgi:RecJ-like exonuclease